MTVMTRFVVIIGMALWGSLSAAPDEPATMNCLGGRRASVPVVILEAGAGNGVETWARVQAAIAEFTRVCAYDRPGLRRYWTNGNVPSAPTPDAVIHTLDAALSKAAEPPSYVLVGHSYGGMIVRLYASRFPERVHGMVLIDSSHEDQLRRFGTPPPSVPAPGTVPSVPEVFDLASMSAALSARPWHTDRPLVVLTRGYAGSPNAATPPDAAALARYRVWLDLQRELASRSTRAEHIVAKNSGHYIQNDEPELVIDAVRRVVATP